MAGNTEKVREGRAPDLRKVSVVIHTEKWRLCAAVGA